MDENKHRNLFTGAANDSQDLENSFEMHLIVEYNVSSEMLGCSPWGQTLLEPRAGGSVHGSS